LVPLDRRRARGAHGRLKQALIEGSTNGADRTHRWKDFSSAMDRQAVGEALSALPQQQRQVVKLAYFGGLTNREIADHLGVPVGGVRRRLRQALATASEYVEHGRATGGKIAFGLVAWFCGRSLETTQRSSGAGLDQMLRAGMVVAAGVTVTAVLGTAAPATMAPDQHASIPAMTSEHASAVPAPKTTVPATDGAVPQNPVAGRDVVPVLPSLPVTVPVPAPPIQLPVEVQPPPLPINLPVPSPAPIPPIRLP
jgi:hypothetical protein